MFSYISWGSSDGESCNLYTVKSSSHKKFSYLGVKCWNLLPQSLREADNIKNFTNTYKKMLLASINVDPNYIVNNTFEYPMLADVEPNELIAQFGLNFKQDLKTKVSSYGTNQADVLKIMTEAGWE